jgi:DnaD/phage-associated family protein
MTVNHFWIKLFIEILDDPKMGKLPDFLWRRAIEFFLLAGDFGKGGLLPSVTDMAWRLRVDEGRLSENLEALSGIGVVTPTDQGWVVTRFQERQKPLSGAERAKKHREKKRECNDSLRARYTDIDIEIEVEKDIDSEKEVEAAGAVFTCYENNIGVITPVIRDEILEALDEAYPVEWILDAIKISAEQNKRSWAYARAILERWKVEGKDSGRKEESPQEQDEESRKRYGEWES